MKIGILTFHWATNYGAVLQAFALQKYLESVGFDVVIINYKPKFYDDTLWNYLVHRKFINHTFYIREKKKEAALSEFRLKYLRQTKRIYKYLQISEVCQDVDILISGSDQVLNPSFLKSGEGRNNPSSAYFLDIPFLGKKIGYAVSFGCTEYPIEMLNKASEVIKNFHKISTREVTGVRIVKSMGRDDAVVVPDPTLLLSSSEYEFLIKDSMCNTSYDYTYCFFLRNISERKTQINMIYNNKTLWNNEDCCFGLQDWLKKIKYSNFVITDSFHCVVLCLKLHKPFVVVTEKKGNVGMNDRLFTLLSTVCLDDRILHKSNIDKILNIDSMIDWGDVDDKLDIYSEIGKIYLNSI